MAQLQRPDAGAHGGRRLRISITCLMLAGVAFALLSFAQRPVLLWNFSESLPVGLYRLSAAEAPRTGDIVAIEPHGAVRETLLGSGALASDRLLLKPVAAQADDMVCHDDDAVTVNGRAIAPAPEAITSGVPQGCRRLAAHEIYLISPRPRSFDSRYFGPVSTDDVVGVARPLLTFERDPRRRTP